MKKENKIQYFNKKSIAYYSGLNGLEIKDIIYDIDDHIVFAVNCWYGKNTYKDIHIAKIYHSADNSYFKYNGYRIHLNDCIRID